MKSLVKFSKYEYIDSLLDGKLKASFSHEFNDPFDSRMYVSDENKELLGNNFGLTSVQINFYFHMFQTAQIGCLINCDPLDFEESVLMWAHYAESGKNISVCFDQKLITDTDKEFKDAWLKVDYDKPLQSSKQFLEEYVNSYIKNDTKAREKIVKDFFSSKYKKWSYEQEVRIMHFKFIEKLLVENYELFSMCYTTELIDILDYRFRPFSDLIESKYKDTLYINLQQKPNKVIIGYNFDEDNLPALIEKCETKHINLSRLILPEDFTHYTFEEEILREY